MLNRAYQKFRCFWLFWAKSCNPPNYAKCLKFSILPQTYNIDNIKTFYIRLPSVRCCGEKNSQKNPRGGFLLTRPISDHDWFHNLIITFIRFTGTMVSIFIIFFGRSSEAVFFLKHLTDGSHIWKNIYF